MTTERAVPEVVFDGRSGIIDDPRWAVHVYDHGCFGKGTFSRSDPEVMRNAVMSTLISRPASEPPVEETEADEDSGAVAHAELEETESGATAEAVSGRAADTAVVVAAATAPAAPVDVVAIVERKRKAQTLAAERARARRLRAMALAQSAAPSARERLALQPEEAHFLSVALGRIGAQTGSLWAARAAPARLAAYWHLRARGWTPRAGLRLGADWLVYRGGPAQAHAEAVVLVRVHCPQCGMRGPALADRRRSWIAPAAVLTPPPPPASTSAPASAPPPPSPPPPCAVCRRALPSSDPAMQRRTETLRRVRLERLAAHVAKALLVLDVLHPPQPDAGWQRCVVAESVWVRPRAA